MTALKSLPIFFLLFSACYGNAQEIKKHWNEGKLSWEDFQGLSGQERGVYFRYFLRFETGKERFADTLVRKYFTEAYMLKNESWVNLQQNSEEQLLYYQLIFDILEWYRRKLQTALDNGVSLDRAENIFKSYFEDCNKKIAEIKLTTDNGDDEVAVAAWASKIRNELDSMPAYRLPTFKKTAFSAGVHFDLASFGFAGPVANYLKPAFGFAVGVEFAWKKLTLVFNDALIFNKVKQPFSHEGNWEEGENLSAVAVEIGLSYPVFENSKFKLAPFAAFGQNFFSPRPANEQDTRSINSGGLAIGINTDFKIRKSISLIPSPVFKAGEFTEQSIRLKLSWQKIEFTDQLKGYGFGITAGFNGFINFIKVGS